jgi:hypothetical protein
MGILKDPNTEEKKENDSDGIKRRGIGEDH